MAKKLKKVFELECPNKKCRGKRFEITREKREEDKGEFLKEVIECPYCHSSAVYEIPAVFTKEEIITRLIRGIPE